MEHFCFQCQGAIEAPPGTTIGRTEDCPHCGADVHVCRNCKHYDQSAYNECRENQADRVLDKERSNFCDYFSFRSGKPGVNEGKAQKDAAMKALDELFQK